MTSPVRRAAGALTIVEGAWLLYSFFYGPVVGFTCLGNGGGCSPFPTTYLWASLPLGVILLIVGALGVWGASAAYTGGIIISVVTLAVMGQAVVADAGYAIFHWSNNASVVGAVLAVIAIGVNLAGKRARGGLSEQANPMNLPVFG